MPENRLHRRYPSGLQAELLLDDEPLPARLADISLGGAALELDSLPTNLTPGRRATLRAPTLADGYPFLAEIRSVTGPQLNLLFLLDTDAEFELTMALMADPSTMG